MNQGIVPYLAFWQGCKLVEGRGVTQTLRQSAEKVSEVVESFGAAFM